VVVAVQLATAAAVALIPHPHRIVTQHEQAACVIDLKKVVRTAESPVGTEHLSIVVVPPDQVDDSAADTAAVGRDSFGQSVTADAHAEITQHVQAVFGMNRAVDVVEDHRVHLDNRCERSPAILDDVGVAQVVIGGKPDPHDLPSAIDGLLVLNDAKESVKLVAVCYRAVATNR
jgi:hypothetical protein